MISSLEFTTCFVLILVQQFAVVLTSWQSQQLHLAGHLCNAT